MVLNIVSPAIDSLPSDFRFFTEDDLIKERQSYKDDLNRERQVFSLKIATLEMDARLEAEAQKHQLVEHHNHREQYWQRQVIYLKQFSATLLAEKNTYNDELRIEVEELRKQVKASEKALQYEGARHQVLAYEFAMLQTQYNGLQESLKDTKSTYDRKDSSK
ncbi:MAG: hypothetical protein Q9171_002923 [Xanthocarpia ochracea]